MKFTDHRDNKKNPKNDLTNLGPNRLNKILDEYPLKKKSGLEERVWQKVSEELHSFNTDSEGATQTPLYSLKWFMSIAASIVILVVGSLYFKSEDNSNLVDTAPLIVYDHIEEVTLVLSNNQTVILDEGASVEYKVPGKIEIGKEQVIENSNTSKFHTLVVPAGKRSTLTLSDGTKVWVNSNSRFIYPKEFNGNRREVEVIGEAYFDVVSNKEKPFIVKLNDMHVEVLGTSFNVSAYCGQPHQSIVLVNGSVKVKDSDRHEVLLAPNEKANFRDNEFLSKEIVDVQNYISWKDVHWVLNGESLEQLMKRLELYYEKEIYIISDPLKKKIICGKLYLNDSVEKVLESIQEIVPFTYQIEGNEITLK